MAATWQWNPATSAWEITDDPAQEAYFAEQGGGPSPIITSPTLGLATYTPTGPETGVLEEPVFDIWGSSSPGDAIESAQGTTQTVEGGTMNPLLLMLLLRGGSGMSRMLPLLLMGGGTSGLAALGATGVSALGGMNPLMLMMLMGGRGGSSKIMNMVLAPTLGISPIMAMMLPPLMGGGGTRRRSYRRRSNYRRSYARRY